MRVLRWLLAISAGSLVLLVCYGIAQFLPWGVGSVAQFDATSGEPYAVASRLQEMPPGTWTTEAFDDQLGNGVSTLATDRSFAWIVALPRERYDLGRYLIVHAVTQTAVACGLALVLWSLRRVSRSRRLGTILGVGALGTVAGYGSLMNWWGLSANYAVGESANQLLAWCLALLVIDRILIRQSTRRPLGV